MGVIIALVVSFGALIIGFLGEGGHVECIDIMDTCPDCFWWYNRKFHARFSCGLF